MAVRYVAFTEQGEKVTGVLPVDTHDAAERLLWNNGLVVANLRMESSGRKDLLRAVYKGLPTMFRPKPAELVTVTRQLATLLHSGIPLATSLTILQDRVANPLLKEALAQIGRDIQEGISFSEALNKHTTIFPPLYGRLVTLAEQTGRLEDALNLVSNYLERQSALSRRVTDALRYPLMVALVAIIAGYILVTYSLPSLTSLLEEFGGELPVTARLLIGFTNGAELYAGYVPITAGLVAVSGYAYTRTKVGARQKDQVLLKLPIAGKPLLLSAMFRFTKTLHTTLSAGLPLLDAMDLTTKVESNTIVKEALVRTKEQLLRGDTLSQSIGDQAIFPSVIRQMVAAGEQTGSLAQNLEDLATFFDREAERALTGIAALIEPIMILVVGGGVALLAVTIMSALYGTIGSIQ